MFRSIKVLILSFLTLLICIFMTACSSDKLEEIPFTLNYSNANFYPPSSKLIKSISEFEVFLADESIFSDKLSNDFMKINEKYSENFFEQNDLIAVIIQSTSSMTTGYRLKEKVKSNNIWRIKLESIYSSDNVTDDIGKYFSYYLTVEKDNSINDVELELQ